MDGELAYINPTIEQIQADDPNFRRHLIGACRILFIRMYGYWPDREEIRDKTEQQFMDFLCQVNSGVEAVL